MSSIDLEGLWESQEGTISTLVSWGVSSIYKDAYSLSPVVEGRSPMNKKRECPEHNALCEEVSLCPVCLV